MENCLREVNDLAKAMDMEPDKSASACARGRASPCFWGVGARRLAVKYHRRQYTDQVAERGAFSLTFLPSLLAMRHPNMAVKGSSGDEAPAASTDDKRHGSDTGDSTDGYESGDESPPAPAAAPCWACDQLSPTAECLLGQGQRCLACRQANKPRCNPNKRCEYA